MTLIATTLQWSIHSIHAPSAPDHANRPFTPHRCPHFTGTEDAEVFLNTLFRHYLIYSRLFNSANDANWVDEARTAMDGPAGSCFDAWINSLSPPIPLGLFSRLILDESTCPKG